MKFPTKIPVTIPWSSSEWMPKTVGGLLADDGFLDFVDSWKRELHGSDREKHYMEFIMSECRFTNSAPLSIDLLRRMLTQTIELVSKPPAKIAHPVPAFELIVIMDGISTLALSSLPKRAKKDLEHEITAISGSVLIFAFQAVNDHFRQGSRSAEN